MALSVQVSNYKPYDRQLAFHLSPAKFRLFGGARGPGKSRSLLEEAFMVCLTEPDAKGGRKYRKDAQGIHAIILRTSLTDLEDSIISKFREQEHTGICWGQMGAKF